MENTGIVNPRKTGFTVRCLVIVWNTVSLTGVDDQLSGGQFAGRFRQATSSNLRVGPNACNRGRRRGIPSDLTPRVLCLNRCGGPISSVRRCDDGKRASARPSNRTVPRQGSVVCAWPRLSRRVQSTDFPAISPVEIVYRLRGRSIKTARTIGQPRADISTRQPLLVHPLGRVASSPWESCASLISEKTHEAPPCRHPCPAHGGKVCDRRGVLPLAVAVFNPSDG